MKPTTIPTPPLKKIKTLTRHLNQALIHLSHAINSASSALENVIQAIDTLDTPKK